VEFLDCAEALAVCVENAEGFHDVEVLAAGQVHSRGFQAPGDRYDVHELVDDVSLIGFGQYLAVGVHGATCVLRGAGAVAKGHVPVLATVLGILSGPEVVVLAVIGLWHVFHRQRVEAAGLVRLVTGSLAEAVGRFANMVSNGLLLLLCVKCTRLVPLYAYGRFISGTRPLRNLDISTRLPGKRIKIMVIIVLLLM
jgi:hypothetical protein